MMNIIRADIYRLLRGKALYITFFFILVFLILNIVAGGQVYMGLSSESLGMEMGERSVASGASAAYLMLSTVDGLVYFALPLIVAVAVTMFSCGAAKNGVSTGMPRVKLYFSKWILSLLVCVAAMVFYVGIGTVIGIAVNGLGDWSGGYWLYLLKIFGSQIFVMAALSSLGVFLAFITRSTGAVTGLYFAIIFIPSLVLALLSQIYPNLQDLLKYDISVLMRIYAMFDSLTSTEIVRGYVLSAVYIAITTVLGLMLFKKAEIK